MTASAGSKQIKDGAGSLFLMELWDESGAGTGPFHPYPVLSDTSGNPIVKANPLAIFEPSIRSAAPVALDTNVTAGRQFMINCTGAGNVTVTFSGGGSVTIQVNLGTSILPWEVTFVSSSTTTAIATFTNLS